MLHQSSVAKADLLNNKFSAAFTSDDSDPYSDTVLEGPSIPPISDIIVDENGVLKMLRKLDTKKVSDL